MHGVDYFAAVWPDGQTRWRLLCRCESEQLMWTTLEAWCSFASGTHGFHLVGVCDADVGVAKFAKELRRVPHVSSASHLFFVERMARRLCRANRSASVAQVEVIDGRPFIVEQVRQ